MSVKEDKIISKIKNGDRKRIFTDQLTGDSYVLDYDTGELTNISRDHSDVVKHLKRDFIADNWTPHPRGRMMDGRGIPFALYEAVNEKTGERRITITNLIDKKTVVSFTQSNTIELIKIISEILREREPKKKVPLHNKKYEWFLEIINKNRYGIGIIAMLLRKNEYGLTVEEINEEFKFNDIQKARNVMAKFKNEGLFVSYKRGFKGGMFYVPTIGKDELKNYIEKLFGEQ